LSFLE
jgi:Ca2+-binding EF-hand superfamily protein